MVVTVFRSRLRPEAADEYAQWANRMKALAQTMPGYIGHKTFIAEDGERVTIVEFASEETHRAWAGHSEHVQAKLKDREAFYAEYHVQVCSVTRSSRFPAD